MLRRIVPASAVVVLLLSGLTACSPQQAQAQAQPRGCVSQLKPGVLSDSVQVSTGFGEVPEVSIPKGVDFEVSQRSFAEKAKDRGRVAGENTLVSVNMAYFDTQTGEAIGATSAFTGQGDAPEYMLVSAEQADPRSEAVRCAAVGDRIVLAITAEEVKKMQAPVDSPIVVVIDVVAESALRAEGELQPLPNGFPAVVTNENGQPGVVMPPGAAPEGTRSASRIKGTGADVGADQNVVAQITKVLWDPKVTDNAEKLVMSSWNEGLAGIQLLGNEDMIAESGNTFRPELTGKTVGSQVVIIENSGGASHVYVVDILAASDMSLVS